MTKKRRTLSPAFRAKVALAAIRGEKTKCFTKRRAPVPPDEFVRQVNVTVRGWVDHYRHTNASDAFRTLQRFINIRFRRYLTFQHKGRGFGWKKYPNSRLYKMGINYIGSRLIRYE